MSDEREQISRFLQQMRDRHGTDIEAVALPEGTHAYVEQLVEEGDSETLLFMLKLGYLMGVQAGFAMAASGSQAPSGPSGPGPLQA